MKIPNWYRNVVEIVDMDTGIVTKVTIPARDNKEAYETVKHRIETIGIERLQPNGNVYRRERIDMSLWPVEYVCQKIRDAIHAAADVFMKEYYDGGDNV